MDKTQKIKTSHDNLMFFLIFGIILASFFLLNPKTSSFLKMDREKEWEMFMHTLIDDPINPQVFWKFREFYSYGSILYNKAGIANKNITSIPEEFLIPDAKNANNNPVLYFESNKIASVDIITDAKTIDQVMSIPKNTIKYDKNELVYQSGDNVTIAFIKSISDLRKVNGYLDYDGKDKSMLEGKKWLNLTRIKLN
ncbi:MAG: hypothetical protein HZC02_04375 [Candidatus Levybacteria bacterium]|nr:hypothetical protein [Candidatus Levybacteria bacterium]